MPNHLLPVRPQAVCTSSLMKMPPWSRMILATMAKYSGGGVMKPPTPWRGSAMKPAIRPEVLLRINSWRSPAQRRPAVIGMPQGDDFARAGVTARGQDGGLIGFRAAVGEK